MLRVFDWGEDADGPYLVLEYLGGGSLRDLLDRGVRLSHSQAAQLGTEVAQGLAYAHARGLVHRDIKPANLLFDEEGRVRVADFGVARALAEAAWTEPAGAMVGTARYISPEAAEGKPVDGRADVYSLALVLYEAVTGTVPFVTDTTMGTLMARIGATAAHAPGPARRRAGPGRRPRASARLDAAGWPPGWARWPAALPDSRHRSRWSVPTRGDGTDHGFRAPGVAELTDRRRPRPRGRRRAPGPDGHQAGPGEVFDADRAAPARRAGAPTRRRWPPAGAPQAPPHVAWIVAAVVAAVVLVAGGAGRRVRDAGLHPVAPGAHPGRPDPGLGPGGGGQGHMVCT